MISKQNDHGYVKNINRGKLAQTENFMFCCLKKEFRDDKNPLGPALMRSGGDCGAWR